MRPLDPHVTHRRDFLVGAVTPILAGLAGCTNPPRDADTPTPEFVVLDVTVTYIHDDLDLTLPDGFPRATAPDDADLIILPANTDTPADRVVDWLTTPRSIALLGESAQDTWLDWSASDPYRDTYGGRGSASATPAPQLIVTIPDSNDVHTYRYTWGQEPTDAQVLESIEDALISARGE